MFRVEDGFPHIACDYVALGSVWRNVYIYIVLAETRNPQISYISEETFGC